MQCSMMRRDLLLALLATAATSLPASGQAAADLRPRLAAPGMTVILTGAERDRALAEANAALNAVVRLQGRFVQTAPDRSRSSGLFYLQRPGLLRFQYDPPASLLIISDGSVVSLRDTALRTTERTPLRSTPLRLILAQRVDLARDARITRVARNGRYTMVTARDRTGELDGEITLNFVDLQLESWVVIDGVGATTRIDLSQLTQPAALNRDLFRLEDILPDRRGPRR
jgi:outer membrane lipoprotein-sorting protein